MPFQYEFKENNHIQYDWKLMFIGTDEGYVSAVYPEGIDNKFKFQYVYNHTDHLGNIRQNITKENGRLTVLREHNYYPFGLLHRGYNEEKEDLKYDKEQDFIFTVQAQAGRYKYKFQGQERQEDLNLGWDSFKYRNYDYAIGRFFNVDPLAEKFPYNGVENFRENRGVDAVELEGKEAFYIHGTILLGRENTHMFNNNQYVVRKLTPILGNKTAITSFEWSGKLSDKARTMAAHDLAKFVMENRKEGEPISLIGHSHGGNVAIEASNILVDEYGVSPEQINIVALNTPRSENSVLKYKEVNLYNVNAIHDRVQSLGADTEILGGSVQPDNYDISIYYQDQLKSFLLDVSNHVGPARENAEIWIPQLKAEIEKRNEELKKFENLSRQYHFNNNINIQSIINKINKPSFFLNSNQ